MFSTLGCVRSRFLHKKTPKPTYVSKVEAEIRFNGTLIEQHKTSFQSVLSLNDTVSHPTHTLPSSRVPDESSLQLEYLAGPFISPWATGRCRLESDGGYGRGDSPISKLPSMTPMR